MLVNEGTRGIVEMGAECVQWEVTYKKSVGGCANQQISEVGRTEAYLP